MRNQQVTNDNGHKNGLIYLMAGGAIGAGLALLFAPKSGRELRTDISNTTMKGYDQAKELTANLSEKAKTVYDQAQAKALDTYSSAKEGVNSTIQSAKETLSKSADKVKELADEAGEFHGQGVTGIADKAGKIAQEVSHHGKKRVDG